MIPLILIGLLASQAAQEANAPDPVQVLVLGSFHMGSARADGFNPNVADVLGDRRQLEVAELVEALTSFEPTKVALEATEDSGIHLDYERYLAGEFQLAADERHQVGFRVAEESGLSSVQGVDYFVTMDTAGLFAWAMDNGQAQLAQASMQAYVEANSKWSTEFMEEHSLKEIYRAFNSPATDAHLHSAFVGTVRIGSDEEPVGADLLAGWYDRNVRILRNVAEIAEPGDRILLIYGAVHRRILIDLLEAMPGFQVVATHAFLE